MAGVGLDDDGQPWSEVQHKKNRRNRPDGIEMTFLVQNLPNQVSKGLPWRIFQPHGFVTDAYVARKKDAKGNRFGFVRYVVEDRVEEVLKAMNTVTVFGAKLNVVLAKYDKNHKRFIYTSDLLGKRQEWKPKEPVLGNNGNNQYHKNNMGAGPSNQAFIEEGHSFRDLFRDKNVNNVQGTKSINVDGDGSVYAVHCIGRSILGLAKDIRTLNNINQTLVASGIKGYGLSYVGGLCVLITCHDRQEANEIIVSKKAVFDGVFERFHVWNGEDLPLERVVSVRISGVPFQLRDNKLFERIGSLFGKVVEPSEFSWQSQDNSEDVITILSSQGSCVEESVVLNWKNRKIVVWVSEIPGCWAPDFAEESPEEKSEQESNNEVNQNDDNSVEEGEVRAMSEEDEEEVQSIPEDGRPRDNEEPPGELNSPPKPPGGYMQDMHGVVEKMDKFPSNNDVNVGPRIRL
ncbi:putative RNA recognition motif domain, nucleotide-binding alpha-beta plait domain superfamily [Helianthus annuus]|nr:putative RNA recognition motif domain, nucleotide-binding alpha-beta plait domain superfamily [Helianthus annuus]KAJ0916039.1 putative RNA recognition motif domain, nucleotide-binding alpha-beta plait domain superfamily [Helianthus annuus]